ncbi:MAG: ferric reductase-like transmembrane domain-containing protein [Leptospirales bacterium]|nr:ferric reductase-like transmembrane domain-containing protein [Leptospirales bacterium]
MMHLLGLAAWLLFVLAFIPAVRSRLGARLLGGIAQQHRIHHWLGLSAGFVVLIHVVFELVSEPDSAFAFDDPYLTSGWIALFVLLIGLGFSFTKSLAHRKWVLIHWSLLIALLAAFLHGQAYLHQENLDRLVFYAAVLIATVSIALIFGLRLFEQKWIIVDIRERSPALYEIGLKATGKAGRGFKAGSIVFAQFGRGFSRAWHPFSIASCENNPVMRLLIKSVGTDTSHLLDLRQGSLLSILGPFAEFGVSPEEDQVWIAGGVGIAPFLGMTRCLDFRNSGAIRLVHYQAVEEPDLAREFAAFQLRHSQFLWKTRVTQQADFSEVREWTKERSGFKFLVCGPPAFMRSARKFLIRAGTPSSNIHTEEFSPW